MAIGSDIARLAEDFSLMFDFVANHASIDNSLIQQSLIHTHFPEAADARYADFAISFTESDKPCEEELQALSRPRAAAGPDALFSARNRVRLPRVSRLPS